MTVVDPDAEDGSADDGDIEKAVHVGGADPDWATANVRFATVADEDRGEVEVFCVQYTVTDPGPVPLVGETVSHEPFPEAVQLPPAQPLGAPAMVTTCDPAADPGLTEPGAIVKLVQAGRPTPTAAHAFMT